MMKDNNEKGREVRLISHVKTNLVSGAESITVKSVEKLRDALGKIGLGLGNLTAEMQEEICEQITHVIGDNDFGSTSKHYVSMSLGKKMVHVAMSGCEELTGYDESHIIENTLDSVMEEDTVTRVRKKSGRERKNANEIRGGCQKDRFKSPYRGFYKIEKSDGTKAILRDESSTTVIGEIKNESIRLITGSLSDATSEEKEHNEVLRLLSHVRKKHNELGEDLNKIELQLRKDPFTDVNNRAKMDEDLKTAHEKTMRGKKYSTIFLDLDGLKTINDTHGHSAGDNAIKRSAEIFKECARTEDSVCRLGGDEFVIVCEEGEKGARSLAERILIKIGEENFDKFGKIGVSIGVSEFRADDKSVEDCVERADSALYKSKENGRNQISCFSEMENPVE